MEQNNTKRYLLYFGAIVVLICTVVVLFGRMEFHTELEREVLPHTLIGYMDDIEYDTEYDTEAVIAEDAWPLWAQAFDRQWEDTITFDAGSVGRIGIYADLVYYENRYEKRSWFSGRLIERASEYYYKPEGTLYLEAVYLPYPEIEIDFTQIVPQGYDFMAFNGN